MSTKNCPYCDELIAREAIKCKHCHEFLGEKSRNSEENPIIKIWNIIIKKWNKFAKIPENISETEMQRKILENILFVKIAVYILIILFVLHFLMKLKWYL